jgi:tetratricopeptide (TPR) repeat protein
MMDQVRFQRAISSRDNGNAIEAYDEFDSMLQAANDPVDVASLLLNMATCKAWMGQFDDANELIERARVLFPKGERTPQLYADFAEASNLAASRQFAEAAQKFRELLRNYADLLSTAQEEGLRIDARQRLGFALVASRSFQEALPILDDLLGQGSADQQLVNLYLGIARSFLPAGYEQTKAHFLAASNGPDAEVATEAFCRLGILEFQAMQFRSAEVFLGRAVCNGPHESEWKRIATEYLGQIANAPN